MTHPTAVGWSDLCALVRHNWRRRPVPSLLSSPLPGSLCGACLVLLTVMLFSAVPLPSSALQAATSDSVGVANTGSATGAGTGSSTDSNTGAGANQPETGESAGAAEPGTASEDQPTDPSPSEAPDPMPAPPPFLRIATGAVTGSYFTVANTIASVVSNPSGSARCFDEARCGPPGLIAVAQASEGSVRNVVEVNAGAVETGLAQADIVSSAVLGAGMFREIGAQTDVFVLANLYPETVHLVSRPDAGITGIADLAGRIVSLDRPGSGTHANATQLLEMFGLKDEVTIRRLSPDGAARELAAGTIDAFFYTAGAPVPLISRLIEQNEGKLVPIAGKPVEAMDKGGAADNLPPGAVGMVESTLRPAVIPADVYPGQEQVSTLSVGALWIASADMDADLAYSIVRALFHPENTQMLAANHVLGAQISLEDAIQYGGAQLHPGAERFYQEAGLFDPAPPAPSAPSTPGMDGSGEASEQGGATSAGPAPEEGQASEETGGVPDPAP